MKIFWLLRTLLEFESVWFTEAAPDLFDCTLREFFELFVPCPPLIFCEKLIDELPAELWVNWRKFGDLEGPPLRFEEERWLVFESNVRLDDFAVSRFGGMAKSSGFSYSLSLDSTKVN